ncbi:uncharacterized protein DSM5745_01024 [Aspergillus mulundensis]|uniref:Uncharacterized protein n=1 Tax=Aspergillus mulundensis TaxID=1810919 RepID=A0A3D8T571_9EURO|nr:hypothetical protein DSM5745_01024 [Aspergillus mulundensis]RDW93702.1 hypothetical protein DSM5745_01024 [Aspergillus mulundensis]
MFTRGTRVFEDEYEGQNNEGLRAGLQDGEAGDPSNNMNTQPEHSTDKSSERWLDEAPPGEYEAEGDRLERESGGGGDGVSLLTGLGRGEE